MRPKHYFTLGIVVVAAIVILSLFTGLVGINEGQNWIYLQHLNGTVKIVDSPGMYAKWFGKTWVYPRFVEFRYNDDPADGDKAIESIGVTYNDGGTADVSTYIRLSTPTTKESRVAFHQQFGGNMDNIKASTKSYMIDCLKSTAPLMSSSENQSARKAEFKQVVEGQLKQGTYKMRKETVRLQDETDDTGNVITIFKTEIVTDADGMPVIISPSPIVQDFDMTVVQFSVTGTNYDTETRKQFAAKKQSFLLTEQAKADREKETQERLMVIEKGLREKAEAEAIANVVKIKAVIAAEQKAEVALQTKIEAETKAEQLLSVAEIDKAALLMAESAKFEQAEIEAQTAIKKKEAMIAMAEGKKEAIELSGDITELEEALIRSEVDKAKVVAEALAKINVPSTMIIGGENGQGNSTMENLINLKLMESTGILDKTKIDKTQVQRKVSRPASK
jgi:hypothetical protein